MTWRLYAQRTVTGEWLHTDVPASCALTWELNGSGYGNGFIPDALDVSQGSDGLPLWLERGTTLYAEEDGRLEWVGLCSFQRRTPAGRELEWKGLSWAYDLIGFDGRIREWQPDPFDLVGRLAANAHAQPNGDVGLHVVTDGKAPTYAGDEQPPTERPKNVHRAKGETKDQFDKRQKDRTDEQQKWDKAYGDRQPYSVAWWEAPYVLEEIRDLAREIPFDWREQHRWADRANLERRSELVVSPRSGRQRSDVALVEGVNIGEVLDPTTSIDKYGNHVVALGAGEGRKMRRAEIGRKDHRVRTTRFLEAKHVHNQKRLEGRARDRFDSMHVSTTLDGAVLRGELGGGFELGDTVQVDSRLFSGWCRVQSITRDTHSDTVSLTFTTN